MLKIADLKIVGMDHVIHAILPSTGVAQSIGSNKAPENIGGYESYIVLNTNSHKMVPSETGGTGHRDAIILHEFLHAMGDYRIRMLMMKEHLY